MVSRFLNARPKLFQIQGFHGLIADNLWIMRSFTALFFREDQECVLERKKVTLEKLSPLLPLCVLLCARSGGIQKACRESWQW
jgi:hypothetical protein